MNYTMSVEQIKEAIRDRLAHTFAVSLENATDEEYYKASALIVRELLAKGRSEFVQNAEKTGTKQIYYLCMEFLLGRSLRNNLCNLGLEENFRKALAAYMAKNVPQAASASFDGEASVDFNAKTVSASFHADDPARTVLVVAYADGKFTVTG